jgi:hypothetical protein
VWLLALSYLKHDRLELAMTDRRLTKEERKWDKKNNPDPQEFEEDAYRRQRTKEKARITRELNQAMDKAKPIFVKKGCIYNSDTQLTNFVLEIKEQIKTIDGSTGKTSVRYKVSGITEDGTVLDVQQITANELRKSLDTWVSNTYGAELEISQGCKAKAVEAILYLSKGKYKTIHETTRGGYQTVKGKLVYVAKRGAITGDNFDKSIRLAPGRNLNQDAIHLVDPKKVAGKILEDCLSFTLDLPKHFPSNPLLGVMLLLLPIRAVISYWLRVDTSVCFVGRFGTGKTSLAKVIRAFFNHDLKIDPIRWNSSESALYETMSLNSHAVLPIDDFLFNPAQQKSDSNKVSEILQAAVNGTAPAKMLNGSTLRGAALLNTMVISTANAIPQYASDATYSRIIFLDVDIGHIPNDALTILQEHAAKGKFVHVTSSFIQYLIGYDQDKLNQQIKEQLQRYRKQGIEEYGHDERRKDIFATALISLDLYLDMCEEANVLDKSEADDIFHEYKDMLGKLLSEQNRIKMKKSIREILIDALWEGVASEGLTIVNTWGERSPLFASARLDDNGWTPPSLGNGKLVGWYDEKTQILHVLSTFPLKNLKRFVPPALHSYFFWEHDSFWIDMVKHKVIYEKDKGQKNSRRRRFELAKGKSGRSVNVYCIKIDMEDPYKPFIPEWEQTGEED